MTLQDLQKAAITFQTAIREFNVAHELNTVGCDEWIESIDETLDEIEEELNEE